MFVDKGTSQPLNDGLGALIMAQPTRTCQGSYRIDAGGAGYDLYGSCLPFGVLTPLGYENRPCAPTFYQHPSPSGSAFYDDQGWCRPPAPGVISTSSSSGWVWIVLIAVGVGGYLVYKYFVKKK